MNNAGIAGVFHVKVVQATHEALLSPPARTASGGGRPWLAWFGVSPGVMNLSWPAKARRPVSVMPGSRASARPPPRARPTPSRSAPTTRTWWRDGSRA